MPKQKIAYSKTVIYRIHCNNPNILDDYIGSTTDLTRKKQNHKKIYHNKTEKSHNDNIYKTIRCNGGWDNWKITELEKYPCKDKNEATLRETYWKDLLYSTLSTNNSNININNPKNPNVNTIVSLPEICKNIECSSCDKTFQYRSGLWKHKKKCGLITTTTTSSLINPETILDIIHQNNEFKEMLITQSKQATELQKQSQQHTNDLQKQIIELCKNTTITNNTNNNSTINNNSHNKTFNLQIFLNDTCKNAMNLTDFVSSLQINLKDLESVGELGFVNGLSKLIINGLNDLKECERPVHCSDLKRESMYVKDDNKWEKEDAENTKMKRALKQIAHKNIKMLPVWKTQNPDCKRSDSHLSDTYSHMVIEAMGGSGDNDEEKANKIIRKIAKEVTIKKQILMT
jgi:hypothetical protein